jgi:hypothetical protein
MRKRSSTTATPDAVKSGLTPFPVAEMQAACDARDLEKYCWLIMRWAAENGTDLSANAKDFPALCAAVDRMATPLLRLKLGGLDGLGGGEGNPFAPQGEDVAAAAFGLPPTDEDAAG